MTLSSFWSFLTEQDVPCKVQPHRTDFGYEFGPTIVLYHDTLYNMIIIIFIGGWEGFSKISNLFTGTMDRVTDLTKIVQED